MLRTCGLHKRTASMQDTNSCPIPFYAMQRTTGKRSTTREEASVSLDACVCLANYYNSNATSTGTGAVHCKPCPIGTACDSLGSALVSLPLRRGYHRLNNDSIDVRRCPDSGVNCDGDSVCDQTSSGCRGGSRFASQCHGLLRGVYCKLCPELNAVGERLYYQKAMGNTTASCEPCEDTLGQTIALAFSLVGILLVGMGFIFYVGEAPSSSLSPCFSATESPGRVTLACPTACSEPRHDCQKVCLALQASTSCPRGASGS